MITKQRLFLQKNPTATDINKRPVLKISMPPEEGSDEWKDVAVFWPSKTGKGYSGVTVDGVGIVFESQDDPKDDSKDEPGDNLDI